MSATPYIRPILACAVVAIMLTACKKAEAPAPALGGTAGSGSVATPENSMPAPAAQMPVAPPDAAASSGANANSPTQASPQGLTNKQESSSMPLPGQANDHSTPETPGQKK
ncbi:MAG: hypothetical protein ABI575_06080 [Oxalobacteraceae bacterium]